MLALTGLDIGVDPDAWHRLGFAVDPGGVCPVDRVAIRLGAPGRKLCAWAFDGVPGGVDIDGLPTVEPATTANASEHPNGTVLLDHLVILSPAPARTVAALARHGIDVRDRRHTDQYGPPFTQTFFRVGRPVLELIGPDEPTGEAPARFYGVAFTVLDLDATAAFLGERLGDAKDAVQPGRRIATLRKEAGAGIPLAFMSPGFDAVDLFDR